MDTTWSLNSQSIIESPTQIHELNRQLTIQIAEAQNNTDDPVDEEDLAEASQRAKKFRRKCRKYLDDIQQLYPVNDKELVAETGIVPDFFKNGTDYSLDWADE